nr:PspC domain-containing protein [Bifidobacterium bohemicum]
MNRFFGWIRRSGLIRGNNRWIGGVCDGIAMRYDVSVVFVRVILTASVLICGAGLVFYAAAWALLPDCRDGRIMGEDLVHGQWQWTVLAPIILLMVGVSNSRGIGAFFGLLAIGLLLVIVNILVNRVDSGRGGRYYQPQAGGYGPYGPSGSYAPQGDHDPRPWSGSASQPSRFQSYDHEGFAGSGSQYGARPMNDDAGSFSGYSPAGPAGSHVNGSGPNPYAQQAAYGTPYYYQAPPMYRSAAPRQVVAQPPVASRLRRKPAGFAVVLLFLGAILVSGAVAALFAIDYGGLESTLKVATIWIAVVLAALGLGVLALGIAGRRAGGLHPMIWIAALLAVVLVGTDAGYSWIVSDMHRLNDSWHQVSLSGFQAVDGSNKAELSRLRRGVAVSGNDFDHDVLNVDLSDYGKGEGTHDVTLGDGTRAKSACPTGRIDLTAQRSQVFVTLPAGCSYGLMTGTDDPIDFQRQLYQTGRIPSDLNLHLGLNGGSIRIDPDDSTTSVHSGRSNASGRSRSNDRNSGTDQDSDNDNGDQDGDTEPYCDDDSVGISIGEACLPNSPFGVKSVGGRYTAIRYGSAIGLWNGRGVRIGEVDNDHGGIASSSSGRNDGNYSWYYDKSKMPKGGPELTVVVPFVVEGKVTVQYPYESHVKSYIQYVKERD